MSSRFFIILSILWSRDLVFLVLLLCFRIFIFCFSSASLALFSCFRWLPLLSTSLFPYYVVSSCFSYLSYSLFFLLFDFILSFLFVLLRSFSSFIFIYHTLVPFHCLLIITFLCPTFLCSCACFAPIILILFLPLSNYLLISRFCPSFLYFLGFCTSRS